jgi:hypothetical protein
MNEALLSTLNQARPVEGEVILVNTTRFLPTNTSDSLELPWLQKQAKYSKGHFLDEIIILSRFAKEFREILKPRLLYRKIMPGELLESMKKYRAIITRE